MAIWMAIKKARRELAEEMRGKVSEMALTIVDTRKELAQEVMEPMINDKADSTYGGYVSDPSAYAKGMKEGAGVYGHVTTESLRWETKSDGRVRDSHR